MKRIKSNYEVRISISVVLPSEKRVTEGEMFGALTCTKMKAWGQLAHMEFVGEYRAWKRWAVASKAMQHLHDLIEDGSEVILYIEEKN